MENYSERVKALYQDAMKEHDVCKAAYEAADAALAGYRAGLERLKEEHGYQAKAEALGIARDNQDAADYQVQMMAAVYAVDAICRVFSRQRYETDGRRPGLFPNEDLRKWLASHGVRVTGHVRDYDLWTLNCEMHDQAEGFEGLLNMDDCVDLVCETDKHPCMISRHWADSRDGGDTISVSVSRRVYLDLDGFVRELEEKYKRDYPEPAEKEPKEPNVPKEPNRLPSVMDRLPEDLKSDKQAMQTLFLELVNAGYSVSE